MLNNILLVVHLIVATAIVILVLLQRGKGADMGAAFGGGSSQSLFGARGSANFLSRATSVLATVLFISSLTLAYLYTRQSESVGIGTSVTDSADATGINSAADSIEIPPDADAPPAAAPDAGASEAAESDVPAAPPTPTQ